MEKLTAVDWAWPSRRRSWRITAGGFTWIPKIRPGLCSKLRFPLAFRRERFQERRCAPNASPGVWRFRFRRPSGNGRALPGWGGLKLSHLFATAARRSGDAGVLLLLPRGGFLQQGRRYVEVI